MSMQQTGRWLIIASLLAVTLSGLLLAAGCEVFGQYHDDNVDVQFGNSNAAAQARTQ